MINLTVKELRNRGHAVVVFSPGELNNADPRYTEQELVIAGWEIIDSLNEQATKQEGVGNV